MTQPSIEDEAARVLVVDDDPRALDVLHRVLVLAGYLVDQAATIAEARVQLNSQAGSYEAAVLDLELTDGNGAELLRDLRAPSQACCALVLSGYTLGPIVEQLRARGAARVLTKPVGMEELVTAVRQTQLATAAYREDLHAAGTPIGTPGGMGTVAGEVETGGPVRDAPPLTPRETDVLALLQKGHTTKVMAKELGVSERTVKFHVGNLLKKFDARSRIDLLAHLGA